MRTLQNAHNASELPNRHGHDTGAAAASARFFSQSTARLASHYFDVSWTRVGLNIIGALGLIAVSRVPGLGGFAPFLLITGLVWAAVSGRVAMVKATGRLGRRG